MRKFSKFVSILLIGSLVFSVSACNKNGGKSNEETYTFPNTVETVARGTHTDRTTAAEGYVVRNQASSYSIVIPADASNELRMTASELSDIVADVTGARLTVITDEGLSFDKDATYLSRRNVACKRRGNRFGRRIFARRLSDRDARKNRVSVRCVRCRYAIRRRRLAVPYAWRRLGASRLVFV